MGPDTSHWRDSARYAYFDTLSTEGLAWECLRRNEAYQRFFASLAKGRAEDAPLDVDAERRWGLRYRGGSPAIRP